MAEFTDRDKIWNNAMMQDEVHPSRYEEVFGISKHEARETLLAMYRVGILERSVDSNGIITYSTNVDHPLAGVPHA